MAIQPVGAAVPPTSAASPSVAVSRATSAIPAEQPKVAEAIAASQPSREQIDRAMGEVKKALAPVARNLQFSLDTETGRTVVKVVDSSTNEVIRQIPSEELLNLAKTLDKFTGLLLKQKA